MTDEAEEVAARGGGYEEYILNSGHVNGQLSQEFPTEILEERLLTE